VFVSAGAFVFGATNTKNELAAWREYFDIDRGGQFTGEPSELAG